MKAQKFTFKTERETWSPDSHYIKLKKITVGSIADEHPHKISLQVIKADINEDGNPNCPWKWIRLKREFASIQEAKDFLNANIETILSKYQLNLSE